MNFLSPIDVSVNKRRRSFCNEKIIGLEKQKDVPKKTNQRRNSLNNNCPQSCRRDSFVVRWFKHISDVAEQYKPRSKNNTNEQFEDIGSTTLPHSNTKESLESTPERTNSNASSYSQNKSSAILPDEHHVNDIPPPLPLPQKNTVDRADILLRSVSKKSLDNEYVNSSLVDDSNHQSKRDSNSHLCSNNSNETRTLMQDNQLQEPTAVQISISSVHTAEPILTQSELLKRLDVRIRNNLSEKFKIICEMFRIPVEHYHEIVDIVEQPETPKDCSDIILAAYAQMQTLTETLNNFTKITPEKPIQISTSLCDMCHEKKIHFDKSKSVISNISNKTFKPDPPNVEENRLPEPPIPLDVYQEDDDGYCELADVRPTGLQKQTSISESGSGSSSASTSQTPSTSSPPELLKRQSLISVDSIPEESEIEIQETEMVLESLEEGEHVDHVDKMCHTVENAVFPTSENMVCSLSKSLFCGPSRLVENTVITELSIPLSSISSSILTLNTHISQLMPKINERDAERDQLKKENQHLREMLSALHERLRSLEDSQDTSNVNLESSSIIIDKPEI